MQLVNSSYFPAREADFGGHGICSLIGHFPVTLYADTAFSLRAKFCPLLKSLGSKLLRFLYIVIWISMCFLACHPCSHRVGKETLCCSLPCDKWAFLVVLVNHMFPVLPKQEHFLQGSILKDAGFAEARMYGAAFQRHAESPSWCSSERLQWDASSRGSWHLRFLPECYPKLTEGVLDELMNLLCLQMTPKCCRVKSMKPD